MRIKERNSLKKLKKNMAKINKVYAVKNGRHPGIYHSWSECNAEVQGFVGAKFKSFATEMEAQAYLNDEPLDVASLRVDNPNMAIAYTDGSYNDKNNSCGYGAIIISQDEEIETFGTVSVAGHDIASLRQIPGEIAAVITAIRYCRNNGIKNLTVYHDYNGISEWATGKWKTNNVVSQEYKKIIDTCGVNISFIKVAAHANNSYNTRADAIAREACA